MNKLKIMNKADTLNISIFGEIGGWAGEVDTSALLKTISDFKGTAIDVEIHSGGGDVFDGLAIYNALLIHPANVTVTVQGLAASAASVIAMAGDTIKMPENAFMMVHQAWSIAMGTADNMRETADLIDRINGTIADIYTKKTGRDYKDVADDMKAETWLDAEQAFTLGYADEVIAEVKIAAQVAVKNPPPAYATTDDLTSVRGIEKALKAHGFGAGESKKIISFFKQEKQADEHQQIAGRIDGLIGKLAGGKPAEPAGR